jgi:Bcr/CflA subfamily drug resistance transporter
MGPVKFQRSLASLIERRVVVIGLCVATLNHLAMGLYLPSMPTIAREFGLSDGAVQRSLSAHILGIGVSQLGYGAWSDRKGRRPVFLFGLSVCASSAFACAFVRNAFGLLVLQAAIGFGVGCTIVVRAMFRDVFEDAKLITSNSHLSAVSSVTLIASPLLGGFLVERLGFPVVMGTLFIIASLLVLVVWALLPETLQPHEIGSERSGFGEGYRTILLDRCFQIHTTVVVTLFAGLIACDVLGPFIFQKRLGLSPMTYSSLTFLTLGAYLSANLSSGMLVRRWGVTRLVRLGLACGGVAAASLLYVSSLQRISVGAVIVPITLYMVAYGFVFPVTVAKALQAVPQLAGSAASLAGSANMLLAVAMSAGLSLLRVDSLLLLGLSLAVLVTVSAMVWLPWSVHERM